MKLLSLAKGGRGVTSMRIKHPNTMTSRIALFILSKEKEERGKKS